MRYEFELKDDEYSYPRARIYIEANARRETLKALAKRIQSKYRHGKYEIEDDNELAKWLIREIKLTLYSAHVDIETDYGGWSV